MTDILVSPGFGAGWTTWCNGPDDFMRALRSDPKLVEIVRNDKHLTGEEFSKRVEELKKEFGEDDCYTYEGGVEDLIVVQIPEGEQFYIHEYDGSESVKYRNSDNWDTA
jgi:hypothetical protein